MQTQKPAAAAPRRTLAALRERLPHTVSRGRACAAVVIATIGLVGLGAASAATLNTDPGTLTAGAANTAPCQAGAPFVAELTSVPAGAAFATTGVVVSNVNEGCAGETYQISLVAADGSRLAEATGPVPSGGTITAVLNTAANTADVTGVKVVIS